MAGSYTWQDATGHRYIRLIHILLKYGQRQNGVSDIPDSDNEQKVRIEMRYILIKMNIYLINWVQ